MAYNKGQPVRIKLISKVWWTSQPAFLFYSVIRLKSWDEVFLLFWLVSFPWLFWLWHFSQFAVWRSRMKYSYYFNKYPFLGCFDYDISVSLLSEGLGWSVLIISTSILSLVVLIMTFQWVCCLKVWDEVFLLFWLVSLP